MTLSLGFIVNPIAGMGGSVGLKGTDGEGVVRLARALGARPVAPARAGRMLARLEPRRKDIRIVTATPRMGGDLARGHGFETEILSAESFPGSGAAETRSAATEMERRHLDLILFAGGDGTARDIVDAVGARVPILGVPTGVKMHSAVFATSPEAAADVIASALSVARPLELRNAEVMDVDEAALRQGHVSTRLYGVAQVPCDRSRIQNPKAGSRAPNAELDALCRRLAEDAAAGGLTIFGPGTTTQRILAHMRLAGTLLGVDAVERGALVGSDLNEAELLELLDGRPARLVLGVIGGQGFLLGRGNQQLSPAVIRRIGLENVVFVSALDKVVLLDPPVLRVDTGDRDLDRLLDGYHAVRVAPRKSLMVRVVR